MVASRAMPASLSRRELLATAGAGFAIAATAGQRVARAEALTGGIKITMPVGELTEDALAFVAYLGVDYVTTGGPASPTYTPEGRVVQARPTDPAPPWKDADLRRMKDTVERAGLKLGNVMLHDFRRAILGRPGADEDIELVKESIRAAGRVGIPIVETGTRCGRWAATTRSRAAADRGSPRTTTLAAATCPCSTTSARIARPTCGRATSAS